MKVLQINSVCGIRSTGRICTDIAQVLEAAGHTCMVAYGRESVPEKLQKFAHPIATVWSNRLDGIASRIFDNAGFNSKTKTQEFIKWMKEYDPDIIHLHNIHGYYIHVGLLFQALKEMGKPVIWTLHDCWSFTGHCSHFDFAGCDKWRTGCRQCERVHVYPSSLGYDNARNNFARKKELFTGVKNLTIVTPSQWLADLVKQSFLKAYPVQVIPNGIDLSVFKPTAGNFREQYGLQDKKIVLGVASAWGKTKGYADMLKLPELLGKDYQVVIVGIDQDQKDTLPANIIGITRTNNVQQLAEIYTAADLFVNPTYQDTYPTVNLEAQACGTPVITYATGGSVESVPAEQVVEKGAIVALCEAIKHNDSCRVLQQDFSAQTAFAKYLELYEGCLKK